MDDRQLTEHFRLYELTTTTHDDLQYVNRILTENQAFKLQLVAELLETARGLLDVPLVVSSGYRCPALNAAVGSGLTSQHLLCEAADTVPKGLEVAEAFKRLRQAAKDGKIQFGQMIYEKANRSYSGGIVEWIHLSLGAPYRPTERCGEILNMVDGQYTLIETIPQGGNT